MKLAEIIVHEETSHEATDLVVQVARRCGKNPQVIKDQPLSWGFVANRILMAICHEADRLVAEGVAQPEQVDAILRDCFRWPTGPFEMFNGAGSGWEASNAREDSPSMKLAAQLVPFTFNSGYFTP